MSFGNFLLYVSAISWTIVYIESIRVGLKDKSYAMPLWALALNLGWEVLHSYYDYIELGWNIQVTANIIWAIFDLGILYTFLKYGYAEFKQKIGRTTFYIWTVFVFVSSFIIQYMFINEFGVLMGATYAAFIQNLIMSALFINLLFKRNSRKGQSMVIAIAKAIGTFAPTILFGYRGVSLMGGPNNLVLTIGIIILILDLIYIFLLRKTTKKHTIH